MNRMRLLNTISSSNVRAIRHDESTSTLRITFTNGATYEYANVTIADATALERETDSIGRAIRKFTTNNSAYPCTRL